PHTAQLSIPTHSTCSHSTHHHHTTIQPHKPQPRLYLHTAPAAIQHTIITLQYSPTQNNRD
ncbi:hypothetical protein NDU88_000009, partial [Pleurodeles waltl]